MKKENQQKSSCVTWLVRGSLIILVVIIFSCVLWLLWDDNIFGRVLKTESPIEDALFPEFLLLDAIVDEDITIMEIGEYPTHSSSILGIGQMENTPEFISVGGDGVIVVQGFPEMEIIQKIELGYQQLTDQVYFYDNHQKVLFTGEDSAGNWAAIQYDLLTKEIIDRREIYFLDTGELRDEYYMDPTGTFLFKNFTRSCLIIDIKRGTALGGPLCYLEYSKRFNEHPGIFDVRMDDHGDYTATLVKNGDIVICPLSETATGGDIITENSFGEDEEHRQILFSPTRTHFTWLTSEKLIIWKLGITKTTQLLEFPIDDGQMIAFDRTGEVLFIGTTSGLKLLDIDSLEIIGEYPTGVEVTSLFISRDNRLLVWGDTEGNLHIWGVPVE